MGFKKFLCIASVPAFALWLTVQAQAGEVDNTLLELKKMIEQQQAQIDKQAIELSKLREQLSGNTQALTAKADKSDIVDKEDSKTAEKMVISSSPNVNLSLYGHMNKAGLFVETGDDSNVYVVDNTSSQTRLGLKAAVDAGSGLGVGGRIEYGIVSNGSWDVDQNTSHDATDDNFKLRWAEVSFKNDKFGSIHLGKGSSASDGTSEVDLSGTAVVTYSSISDMIGSVLWYDNNSDTLSDVRVKNVFNNFDGLSRTDRILYDSPSWGGFSFATSASSGNAFDGALLFNRKYGETKVAAAFGVANPGDVIEDTDVQYSGSASVLLPMGLNATFAAATRDLNADRRDDPVNWWGKLGYQTNFYEAATTSFSIEYGETNDLSADGDEASTWAAAVVHNIPDWGTEF